jgi:anti-sigma factor ChrR (cupin superfamily)
MSMPGPKYTFSDSNALPWEKDDAIDGMETKSLGAANGQTMELFRFAPNTAFPEHIHKGPEFVYVLAGSARLSGQWLEAGWSSAGEAGTVDEDFLSGDKGCVLVAVYTP